MTEEIGFKGLRIFKGILDYDQYTPYANKRQDLSLHCGVFQLEQDHDVEISCGRDYEEVEMHLEEKTEGVHFYIDVVITNLEYRTT